MDIEVIKMQEYIDSSNQVRDDENFIDFIKKSQ
jgi:hypothetical protein